MTSATVPWAESCRTLFTNCSKAEAIISWVQSGGNFHCFSFKRQKQLRPDWDRGPHSRHWHKTIARKCNQSRLQRVYGWTAGFLKRQAQYLVHIFGTRLLYIRLYVFSTSNDKLCCLLDALENLIMYCLSKCQFSLRKTQEHRNWRSVYRVSNKDVL